MRQMTIQRVMIITLFALIFTMAIRAPIDTDTWWHIRSGEHTLSEGMIYQDPFSHTKAGEDWVNHSWGAQIILYGVWSLAGNIGLALYVAVLATGGMAVLYQVCAGNAYLRAFTLVIGAAAAAVFWSPRPQMISFFLSTVIVYLLFSYKHDDKDRLWFIVPLMLLWGNLHAGFSIGFILMGGFIAGEIAANIFNRGGADVVSPAGIRKLIIVGLASAAALVVNPYGLNMLLVPFETLSMGALREFIQEWNSPNFQQRQTWPFIILLVGLIGALGASERRLAWSHFVLLGGTLFMALTAGRNIAVFAVVAIPVLTYYADSALTARGWVLNPIRRVTVRQGRLNTAILAVVLLGIGAVTASILSPAAVDAAQRAYLPVDAAEFIAEEAPPGPMFNSYNWGGYLMFALPDYPVYADGRTDLYGDEFLLHYIRVHAARDDWRAALDDDGVNLVVVEAFSALAGQLAEEPGWTRIYDSAGDEDNINAMIFVRDAPLEDDQANDERATSDD